MDVDMTTERGARYRVKRVFGARVSRTCEHCGRRFELVPSDATEGRGRFCSRACRDAARRRPVDRVCEHCGAAFTVKTSKAAVPGQARFCSRACLEEARRAEAVAVEEARFWANVDTSGGPAACWPWLGRRGRHGYGTFDPAFRPTVTASRYAWEAPHGPIFAGLHVLHHCDHRPCCNPAHLFLGTQDDNSADMVAKGRQAVGERVTTSRLTWPEVREIRRRYADRPEPHRRRWPRHGGPVQRLASEYGVSTRLITLIVQGRLWREDPEPEGGPS